MINLNKYSNKRFNKSKFIDRQIKALFLLYDKKVEDLNLTYHQSISLLNHMIKVLVDSEEYEIAEAFKNRKYKKYKKWRKVRRLWSFDLFYRIWRFRFFKIKNNYLNKNRSI